MIIVLDKNAAKHAVKILHHNRRRKLARPRVPDYTRAVEREYATSLIKIVQLMRAVAHFKVLPVIRALETMRVDVSEGTYKAAANAVNYALRTGKLKRKACQKCGKKQVIAHHTNYKKPLKVTWLCNSCHRALHWKEDGNRHKPHQRMDAVIDDVRSAIRDAKVLVSQQVDVVRTVRTVAAQTSQAQKKTFTTQAERVLNIRPELYEQHLAPMMDAFVNANVKLVTNVSDTFFDRLEERVSDGARQGLRAEDIASGIEDDFIAEGTEVTAARKRAKLIARDQVASFRADLDKVRQKTLGITTFVWRTSQDERVRKSHAEREGETFNWEGDFKAQLEAKGLTVDKIDGPPGRPVACRCVAEPVFDDLLGED